MTTVIGGSSPSITFSDSTTQSTAALPLTGGQLSGNLTFATGTNGIVFNNSGATTNSTLNDYETGTWTPTFIATITNPTITYSVQVGLYTKIGNTVYISCRIGASSFSGGSGRLLITGLPFITYNPGSSAGYPYFGLSPTLISNLTLPSGTQFIPLVDYNTTNINLLSFTSGSSYSDMQTNSVTNGTVISVSGFYRAQF